MKRTKPAKEASELPPAVLSPAVRGSFPAIVEFLTCAQWEPGVSRELGTLLICFGEGRWRGWLNDRDAGMGAWLSDISLQGLLEALEGALKDGELEWRPQRKGKGR